MSVFAAVLASSIGNLVHPLFIAFAWLLAEFYSVIPNYAIAIALLTITVMIVVFPITRRGARSMMRMQVLAPDMKVLQAKYKAKPGMATAERQELRQKLNEEMMALYKENGVSPTGGCLPMFLQFPIFWILYATIRGLTHEVVVHGKTVVQPLYISHTTKLYHSITFGHSGKLLPAFGINLSDSVRTAGLSWPQKIPYIVMILVAIALQFVQMKQLSGRNPAAAGEPADAADAEGHAADLRGDLHIHPGRRERLLHRVEHVPYRPAGIHVQARPAAPSIARQAPRADEERPQGRIGPRRRRRWNGGKRHTRPLPPGGAAGGGRGCRDGHGPAVSHDRWEAPGIEIAAATSVEERSATSEAEPSDPGGIDHERGVRS